MTDLTTIAKEFIQKGKAALPAPWEIDPKQHQVWCPERRLYITTEEDPPGEDADTDFIIFARNHSTQLAEGSLALQAENERIGKLLLECGKENVRLKEENERMRKALEFYANKDNWGKIQGHTTWASNLKIDDCAFFNTGGGRARAALKPQGKGS